MKSKYKKLNFNKVKTYSIKKRKDKVHINDFAKITEENPSFKQFFASLPRILIAKDFHEFIASYQNAIEMNAMIIFMMGAHVIKVGISPLVIDAMKKGWIKHIAMNGAGAIHDVELAIKGSTSEDVQENLQDGSFGMVKETIELINQAISHGKGKLGYGEAVAEALCRHNPAYIQLSLLATAYNLSIPVTVHSAIGTEIIHQHPSVNGSAIGDTCWRDFQIFTHSVSKLDNQSIVMNAGSAVIMPEVFLKALTVTRNLGDNTFGFTTANFDMIKQYRPLVNVVQRPTKDKGKGYNFIGHHEIMLPLLFCALKSYKSALVKSKKPGLR